MGYKTPKGQNNHLPSAFRSEFQALDHSPPTIVRSPEEVLKSIDRARGVFDRHGVRIRQGNTLDRVFANTTSRLRGNKVVTAIGEIDNNFVSILASAIVAFADEPGIKGALEKISGSDVATSSRRQSPGKDVIWELTMLATLRMSGISSWLAEPDVVADFGFGNYGFACKKIYSENSVEKAIKKGIDQLAGAKLRGVVAINLDELIVPPNRILYASHPDHLRHILQDYIFKFMERHGATLRRYAPNDVCDGYIIHLSASGLMLHAGRVQPVTVNVIHDPSVGESEHGRRLDSLGRKLGNADGLPDWVKAAGGATSNW
jgi:hypothetical protein